MVRIKKIVQFLAMPVIAFSLVAAPFHSMQAAPISYTHAEKIYLTEENFPSQGRTNIEISQFGNRKIVFNLFNTVEQKKQDTRAYINPASAESPEPDSLLMLIDDLDIIHLFSKVNRTTLVSGELAFLHMLLNPLHNKEDLVIRQQFIQELVNNPQLYTQLKKIVDQFKLIEANILRLLETKSAFTKDLKRFYFKTPFESWNKKLNENSYALDIGNRYGAVLNFVTPLAQPILMQAFGYFLLHRSLINNAIEEKKEIPADVVQPSFLKSLWKTVQDTYNPIVKGQNRFANITKQTAEEVVKINLITKAEKEDYQIPSGERKWVIGLVAFMEAYYLYTNITAIKSAYKQVISETEALRELKASLIDLKELFAIGAQTKKMVTNHTLIQSLIPACDSLISLATTATSTPLDTLKNSLDASTFKQKTISYLPPDIGNTLIAYKNLAPARETFVQALYAIGQLDAYLSIATLYKEFESQKVRYCFADYYENNGAPKLEIEELWNPFVSPEKAVANDTTLGASTGPRNMILTGSNTGGKSTFMKGVAYNLYLAQTICIAPSKGLTFTPFGYIGSSLNVSDSQSDDISTFKAEAIRAKNLYAAAQGSSQTFFAFVIIDELFKGTNPKSGGTACYAFAKQLSAVASTIFIFASHFTDAITKVEEATNGICANFKLEISPEEKYKLKPGINTIDTAPDILRKEFADINPQFFDGFFEG